MMTDAPEVQTRPAVVLITDDEALLRMVAAELLNDQGFVTIEAEHAAAALAPVSRARTKLTFSSRMPACRDR